MKFNAKLIEVIFLFIVISCIPIKITHAATQKGILYSYNENDALYDGILESSIWNPTRAIDITLYNIDDQSITMNISILSIFNIVNGSLSFGISIPDTTHGFDIFVLCFKVNPVEPLTIFDSQWGHGIGHDLKIISCYDGLTADGITHEHAFNGRSDVVVAGTEDTYSNGVWDGSQYVIELHTFLDSGDTNGADYSLAENSQIDFFCVYLEETSGYTYTQVREDDGDYDYCTLNVGSSVLSGPSLLFIISGLITTLFVISSITKKKNSKLTFQLLKWFSRP